MKFKVISGENGQVVEKPYTPGEQFYISLDGDLMLVGDGYEDICPGNFNFHLCAFTGLQDCDGREIYEGDVIEHVYFDSKTLKVVVFEHGCFWLATKPGAGKGLMCNALAKKLVHRGQVVERYVIIGNRWQPEFRKVFGDV